MYLVNYTFSDLNGHLKKNHNLKGLGHDLRSIFNCFFILMYKIAYFCFLNDDNNLNITSKVIREI